MIHAANHDFSKVFDTVLPQSKLIQSMGNSRVAQALANNSPSHRYQCYQTNHNGIFDTQSVEICASS